MKFWHIIQNGKYIDGMFRTKWRAERAAAKHPGATVVCASGRAELRQMGIVVDGPTWTPVAPGVYEVKGVQV